MVCENKINVFFLLIFFTRVPVHTFIIPVFFLILFCFVCEQQSELRYYNHSKTQQISTTQNYTIVCVVKKTINMQKNKIINK